MEMKRLLIREHLLGPGLQEPRQDRGGAIQGRAVCLCPRALVCVPTGLGGDQRKEREPEPHEHPSDFIQLPVTPILKP